MRVTGWDDEDMEPVAEGYTLEEGNYFDYIYSATPTWDNDNYDGCTLLTTKPSLQ